MIRKKTLVSAPITAFDPMLLSLATRDWQRMASIVGDAIASQWDEEIHQAGELVLAARLRALAKNGTLEWRGDLTTMHQCEVRLPAKRKKEAVRKPRHEVVSQFEFWPD